MQYSAGAAGRLFQRQPEIEDADSNRVVHFFNLCRFVALLRLREPLARRYPHLLLMAPAQQIVTPPRCKHANKDFAFVS